MHNKEEKKDREEKVADVKGTLQDFVQEELPELSQEEAIRQYKEKDGVEVTSRRNKKASEDDEFEDDEHLKRVKQALLDSLERVNILAKKLFGEKDKGVQKLKVKEEAQKQKVRTQNNDGKSNKKDKQVEQNDDIGRSREE